MNMYEQFIQLVSQASYYLASDRGTEYMQAYPLIDQAASIAREEFWDEHTIAELVSDQLVSVEDIMRKM